MTGQMPDWRTADEFEFSRYPDRKGRVIGARFGCVHWPLAYIHRPKWMAEADFDAFVAALEIKVSVR